MSILLEILTLPKIETFFFKPENVSEHQLFRTKKKKKIPHSSFMWRNKPKICLFRRIKTTHKEKKNRLDKSWGKKESLRIAHSALSYLLYVVVNVVGAHVIRNSSSRLNEQVHY